MSGSAVNARPVPREEKHDRYASTILLRTSGDPAETIGDLRAAVSAINPDLEGS